MKITLTHELKIEDIHLSLLAGLKQKLTIKNPAYVEALKFGRGTWDIPETLSYYEEEPGSLTVPRGMTGYVVRQCNHLGIRYSLADHRRSLPEVHFELMGDLRPYQKEAVQEMMRKDFGVLEAPTGSGKTIMALSLIAMRKQPALIVVHSKELLHQWKERIDSFLGIPCDHIGLFGDGLKRIGEIISVGIINSLYSLDGETFNKFGHVIIDECHRVPSRLFSKFLQKIESKFILGLSATPYRNDGLTDLINFFVGDKVYKVNRKILTENGDILKPQVIWKETKFDTLTDASDQYSKVIYELTQDSPRNQLICHDINNTIYKSEGIVLVVSDRKEHCVILKNILNKIHGIDSMLLTGDVPKKERKAIIGRLSEGKIKVLIATGQLIGEGFDFHGLSDLFLVTPLKYPGRLIQYVGRILRPLPGKRATVHDYNDVKVGVLAASARKREWAYKGLT